MNQSKTELQIFIDTLSVREVEVYDQRVQGFMTKTIADNLEISEATVRCHITMITKKARMHGFVWAFSLVTKPCFVKKVAK